MGYPHDPHIGYFPSTHIKHTFPLALNTLGVVAELKDQSQKAQHPQVQQHTKQLCQWNDAAVDEDMPLKFKLRNEQLIQVFARINDMPPRSYYICKLMMSQQCWYALDITLHSMTCHAGVSSLWQIGGRGRVCHTVCNTSSQRRMRCVVWLSPTLW